MLNYEWLYYYYIADLKKINNQIVNIFLNLNLVFSLNQVMLPVLLLRFNLMFSPVPPTSPTITLFSSLPPPFNPHLTSYLSKSTLISSFPPSFLLLHSFSPYSFATLNSSLLTSLRSAPNATPIPCSLPLPTPNPPLHPPFLHPPYHPSHLNSYDSFRLSIDSELP